MTTDSPGGVDKQTGEDDGWNDILVIILIVAAAVIFLFVVIFVIIAYSKRQDPMDKPGFTDDSESDFGLAKQWQVDYMSSMSR